MEKDLVTIATFASVPEAHLAKNQLTEEGIPAFLADETTISMVGYLSNALGGVKLQVQPEHQELALDILRSAHPLDESALDSEEADALRPSALVEDGPESESISEEDDTLPDQPEVPLNAREELVERAFRAAGLGLLVFPFGFYAIWLLVRVACSSLPLNSQSRSHALIATVLSLPIVALALFIMADKLFFN